MEGVAAGVLLELLLFESLDFDDDAVFDSVFEPDPDLESESGLDLASDFDSDLSESLLEAPLDDRLSVE